MDMRGAAPSRPSDRTADADAMTCTGAAVIAPTSAAAATAAAKHAAAVNATTPQPDSRIASTAVTAAAAAASNTLETLGPPGTITNPATAAKTVAITLSASPAIGSR